MGKTKVELLEEAKLLEVPTDGLNYNELRSAVSKAKRAKEGIEDKKGSDLSEDPPGTVTASGSKDQGKSTEEKASNVESQEPNPTVKKQLELKKQRDKKAKKAKKLAKAQKDLVEEQKSQAEKKSRSKKDTRPVFTDDRGLKFKFKKTAPKTINIDGVSMPISEIIEDNSIMLELVYGGSNFIEQIYS